MKLPNHDLHFQIGKRENTIFVHKEKLYVLEIFS